MRMIWRYISLLCLLNTLAICFTLAYGNANPAPILNWNTSKITLYDSHTGVDFSYPNPEMYTSTNAISGVEIMSSPDELHQLTIFSDPTGLTITLTDQDDENLLQLSSQRDARINNTGWIDSRHFIVMRVGVGSLSLSLVNVETLLERSLGTYSNTAFSFSPNREWLLLIHNDTNESTITHFFDERQYTLNPISNVASWSDNGHYLASRAQFGDSVGFQSLDTTTGNITTSDFVPNRLSWSSNDYSLIAYDRHQIYFYKHNDFIMEYTFSETLLNVIWSYDGNYAVLILQGDDEKLLYLVDNDREVLHFWVNIPDNVDERSILWSYDSHTLSYILPNLQNNGQSAVFIVNIHHNTSQYLTYIPANISRAYTLNSLDDSSLYPNFESRTP